MRSESIAPASPKLRPLEISEPFEAPTCLTAIGSSRAVSPARIFPSLVKALGWRVSDPASGTSTPELLASYDRATQSWKTSALSLFEGSIPYSEAFPRSGTMRNGRIYAPPMSERPTEGKGSGLWPTPNSAKAGNDISLQCSGDGREKPNKLGWAVAVVMFPTPSATEYGTNQGGGMGRTGPIRPSLGTMARKGLWPTPRTKGMCGGTGNWAQLKAKCEDITEARQMGAGNGGQLNPTWFEWLMGYPLGWTDLNALGIALCLRSRKLSSPSPPSTSGEMSE